MRLEIHFNRSGVDDQFTVQAETLELCRAAVKSEMQARGLELDKYDCWSKEVK